MSTTNRLTRQELSQLFSIFFKIGITTIGGGYAMIPMMEHEIVKRTGWLTQEEFLDILAVAQATPGIFAVDMAGHIGHKLGGLRGAIIASVANVLPSFVIILILATVFQQFKESQTVVRPADIAAPIALNVHASHLPYRFSRHRSRRALPGFVVPIPENVLPFRRGVRSRPSKTEALRPFLSKCPRPALRHPLP